MNEGKIQEVIVVEGRDDTNAVKRAVLADTVETHGFGISQETWQLLKRAYDTRGLILFLDPDFSGEGIRRRLIARFPLAKQAYLDRESALLAGDIGIENAKPEDIRRALSSAKVRKTDAEPTFCSKDLRDAGLVGEPGSAQRRERVGKILGIGTGNGKCFLRKLNQYEVTKREFHEAVYTEECKGDKG